MVLQIAGITIKIAISADQYPQTDYFKKVCMTYSISEGAEYDFKVTVGAYNQDKRHAKAIITRNTVSYSENGDESMFYSDSSECCIRWEKKAATLSFAQNVDRYDILFMDYIKMLFSFIAISRGGLPLHSSAVYNEKNGGVIFFCPSGGGKTTIARLMTPEWKVLSDEYNMIMPENGNYLVYSTPFTAPENLHLCTPGHAPVRKLFKLSQSAVNSIAEMPFKDKFLSLGQCIYSIAATPYLGENILKNMQKLCNKIPIQKLSFVHNRTISLDFHRFIG